MKEKSILSVALRIGIMEAKDMLSYIGYQRPRSNVYLFVNPFDYAPDRAMS
jgi:hypothetical protein